MGVKLGDPRVFILKTVWDLYAVVPWMDENNIEHKYDLQYIDMVGNLALVQVTNDEDAVHFKLVWGEALLS